RHRLQPPDGAAHRVDADALLREPAVEDPVVARLDARRADDRARLGPAEALLLQLVGADLAEQPEELAAERALRVAARREWRRCEAGKCLRVLLEVRVELAREARDQLHRRVGRAEER